MKRAIVHKVCSRAWLALVTVLLLFAYATASRAADDQEKEKRGNPPAAARGGPTHTAPAPRMQQEQPRPAPKTGNPQGEPKPVPRTEKAPGSVPSVGNVPHNAPAGGNPPAKAPKIENAPRVPSAGRTPQETPQTGRPRVAPGAGTVPGSPNVGKAPSTVPPIAPQAGREVARPGERVGNVPSGRVMTEKHVPPGDVTRQKDGSYSVRTKTGGEYSMRPNGSVRGFQGPQGEAQFRSDGTVRTVHSRDITIVHRPEGRNLMLRERPDHTVIAAYGGGHGYIQRPFSVHNHEFVQRTYYDERGHFARFYEPYHYHGFALYAYAPVHYYPPLFYSWAYAPWQAGIYFRWGWLGAPWYAYYGPYFAPYPVYLSGPFWLTDYLLAAALEQDYRDRMAAAADEAAAFTPPGGPGQVPLSGEVKQAIADEVRLQLSQASLDSQNVARGGTPDFAYNGVSGLLSDNRRHVFVVWSSLDVTAGVGECILTPGDVLQSTGAPPPPDSQVAYVQVLASKSGDCVRDSLVAVSFQDLQEMLNRMRETTDQGLGELRSGQGQGGLPAAPPAALRGDIDASFAAAAPPPDPNGAAVLNQTERDASAAEQNVLDQAFQQPQPAPTSPGISPPPAAGTIQLGQTIDQVTAILGPPNVVVDLGAKKMYVYQGLKITFTAGRVTDVQ